MATDSNWLHFNSHQPKRKRAELVCIACHSKKIKCDIQNRRQQEHENCTNCSTSGRECRIRPSKREKRKRMHRLGGNRNEETGGEQDSTGDCEVNINHTMHTPMRISGGVDALLATNSTFNTALVIDPELGRTHASPTPLRNIQVRDFQLDVSPQSFFQAGQNTSPAQCQRLNSSHTDTTPTQLGDVDTGFLQVYGPENQFDAENQALVAQLEHRYSSDLNPDLQQIFAETYFTYCYPWCPVLDRVTLVEEVSRSPLLANALALASSHIQPPLLPHDGPETYYKKARTIFYDDEEADGVTSLKALCLFYWWAPQSPSRAHRHSSWWWTSVVIRHAQQMNFHREPALDHPNRERLDLGLRRRIWWTAFARERLTALCQSKPAIIDPDDCNIQEPTLADFPSDPQSQRQGEIFIFWVRLCAIIGRIAKVLLQTSDKSAPHSFPDELREELVSWVHSLPPRLKLSIDLARTEFFDREIHQLHLFYLTTIIILHLKRSGGQLPQALPPAILAASCTARILRDILARGNSRFLMAITCWHVATAFIALLQACRIQHLSKYAQEDINILCHTITQLQQMWASANVIAQGIDRLREQGDTEQYASIHGQDSIAQSSHPGASAPSNGAELADEDGFDWTRFFPFVSKSTNGIAESLISGKEQGTATRGFPSPNNELFHDTLLAQYQDLFDPFTDYTAAFPNLTTDP